MMLKTAFQCPTLTPNVPLFARVPSLTHGCRATVIIAPQPVGRKGTSRAEIARLDARKHHFRSYFTHFKHTIRALNTTLGGACIP